MTDLTFDSATRRFTNSELKTFKRCRRKWWLGSYRGLRWQYEPRSGARAIGTRLHKVMETGHKHGWQVGLDELEHDAAEDSAYYPEQAVDIQKDVELVRAMVEGYIEWSAEEGADEDLEILAAEEIVEVPMPGMPGVSLLGKLDELVFKKSERAVFFRDWKTVGDFSRTSLLHMDEQMLHYMLILRLLANTNLDKLPEALREHATTTVGAIYAQMRKVKRTARAKPPFYQHTTVRHNDETITNYFNRVWYEIRDVLELEQRIADGEDPRFVAYPSPTRDCSWDCDFKTVCPMFDDGSDVETVLSAQYEVASPLERYDEQVSKGDE